LNGFTNIDEVWAFVAIDKDNTEGIVGAVIGGRSMPLVCASKDLVDKMRPIAQEAANQRGCKVLLKRFTTMTVVETIVPRTSL